MDDTGLWYTRCPLPTAFSVALHAGDIHRVAEQCALKVHSLCASASPEIRRAHFTQSLRGTIRQGGHIPPLWSRAEGRDVRLLGLSWTNEAQYVLVLPGSGIKTVADLAGKRLAVPVRPNLPIDFWRATVLKGYRDALALGGLTLGDVRLVERLADNDVFRAPRPGVNAIDPPGAAYQTLSSMRAEGVALLRGEVDAVFAPGHYGVPLRAFTGADILVDLARIKDRLAKLNNPTLLALTIEGSFLDENREVVAHVMSAVLEGATRARADKRAAARVFAAESGNAEELVEEIFGSDFADDLEPRLSEELIEGLHRQNVFLHESGFIPRQVPIEEWIEPAILARAHEIAGSQDVWQDSRSTRLGASLSPYE